MKKLLIILVVICLLFAVAVGYLNRDTLFADEAETAPTAQPSADAVTADAGQTEQSAAPQAEMLDIDAIYALHDPDETVMTVDGKPVTWGEYFSWLNMNISQIQNFLSQYAAYGMALKWSDPVGEDPAVTYASTASDGVESTIMQFLAIEGLAQERGLTLSEDSEAAMAAQRESDILAVCGEGATEEDFDAALAEMHMTPDAYERMSKVNYEYQENFTNIFGENGANISDEEALKYLDDGGYISATHILLRTTDASTGEALDEAAAAAKKTQADELYAELSAITDNEELLKRFNELKEQYCEDSGKQSYPDGYVFTSGAMDASFEAACLELEDYALSEPVKSAYGYHIILRLPQDADRTVSYSEAGTPLSARSLCANSAYAKLLEDYSAGMELKYADGFQAPDLLAFIK